MHVPGVFTTNYFINADEASRSRSLAHTHKHNSIEWNVFESEMNQHFLNFDTPEVIVKYPKKKWAEEAPRRTHTLHTILAHNHRIDKPFELCENFHILFGYWNSLCVRDLLHSFSLFYYVYISSVILEFGVLKYWQFICKRM